MDLLAITKHTGLVETLRTAFEGAGHHVHVVADPLQALASEAWNRAHLILADAEAEPMDGYRLCDLLRGESRMLFRNLPIFLILDHPPGPDDQAALEAADGDGFVEVAGSLHALLATLGPLLEGAGLRADGPPLPALAYGLRQPVAARIAEAVRHFGFDLRGCTRRELDAALAAERPALLFLGVDASGEKAQAVLRGFEDPSLAPYTILVGGRVPEPVQRKLLVSGAMDWLALPLSGPMLLHVCRKALEWHHMRRLKAEYQRQINGMNERRVHLEMEATALRSEVLTDPLTELLNRRAFTQNLESSINQWERHRRPFVLVLGDLDYFKLINDRFGHLVGDLVLKTVGQRIRGALRRSDLAFRIGGEEFAILLMETSLQAGAEVAEKIRQRIESKPMALESGQTVFPTMSFGVGIPDGEGGNLFVRVDEALYMAKHKGRNRVEVAGNPGG